MHRITHARAYLTAGLAAALMLLLLAMPVGRMPVPAGGRALANADQPRRFLVEPAASEITVLLFKEGLFSGLAHDHVLVSKEVSGEVLLPGSDGGVTIARISLPVESFLVDLPGHRSREELDGELSEEDRKEIREAMLAPDLLDAAKHPRITVVVERVEGDWPLMTAWTRIRIHNTEKLLQIPIRAELNGPKLTVSGEFESRHSHYGLVPFSAFLGTVAVRDQFRVKFRIEARERR